MLQSSANTRETQYEGRMLRRSSSRLSDESHGSGCLLRIKLTRRLLLMFDVETLCFVFGSVVASPGGTCGWHAGVLLFFSDFGTVELSSIGDLFGIWPGTFHTVFFHCFPGAHSNVLL